MGHVFFCSPYLALGDFLLLDIPSGATHFLMRFCMNTLLLYIFSLQRSLNILTYKQVVKTCAVCQICSRTGVREQIVCMACRCYTYAAKSLVVSISIGIFRTSCNTGKVFYLRKGVELTCTMNRTYLHEESSCKYVCSRFRIELP